MKYCLHPVDFKRSIGFRIPSDMFRLSISPPYRKRLRRRPHVDRSSRDSDTRCCRALEEIATALRPALDQHLDGDMGMGTQAGR
jgi:hypothetical protein